MSGEAVETPAPQPSEPPPAPQKAGVQGDPLVRMCLLAILLFVGYKVVPFYYYYFDIKSNCAQVLQNADVRSDEELRREWLEVIRSHGIEKEPRDIGIQRIGGRIKMWLNYQEELDVSLLGHHVTLYTFDFIPSAEVGEEE